jgi:hypothetical protein
MAKFANGCCASGKAGQIDPSEVAVRIRNQFAGYLGALASFRAERFRNYRSFNLRCRSPEWYPG